MNILKFAAAAATAFALSSSANAALLVSSTGVPGNTVTNYSEDGLVSFDLALMNFSGARLNFVLQEGDLAGPLNMSALISNMSGLLLPKFNFGLTGISFASAGSVSAGFGTIGSVSNSASNANIRFAKGEPSDFYFGNPLGKPGQFDWVLDTSGMQAGDRFSITAQVPEPASLALMLPLLAGLVAARRRRQRG